jgi:hypothetical protein
VQCIVQLLAGCLDPPVGEFGQLERISDAVDHRLDYPPATEAHDIGDHRVEFDVGLFESLLNPLDMAGLLARQLLAGTQQRPQLLDLLFRNEAGPDQPATHEIGDPHGIVHVGLAAGDILDVRRIGHDQLERPLAQDIPHRFPIDPGRFHRHLGTPALRQPAQQRLKTGCRRVECPALPGCLAANHYPYAGDDRLLVHIETGNALMHHVHCLPLSHLRCRRGDLSWMNSRKRAPGAAVPPLGFSGGVRGTRVKLVNGLFRTKGKPTSVPTAMTKLARKS